MRVSHARTGNARLLIDTFTLKFNTLIFCKSRGLCSQANNLLDCSWQMAVSPLPECSSEIVLIAYYCGTMGQSCPTARTTDQSKARQLGRETGFFSTVPISLPRALRVSPAWVTW